MKNVGLHYLTDSYILIIIIPLFITFGDKNYSNITVKKFKTRQIYIQLSSVKLS